MASNPQTSASASGSLVVGCSAEVLLRITVSEIVPGRDVMPPIPNVKVQCTAGSVSTSPRTNVHGIVVVEGLAPGASVRITPEQLEGFYYTQRSQKVQLKKTSGTTDVVFLMMRPQLHTVVWGPWQVYDPWTPLQTLRR